MNASARVMAAILGIAWVGTAPGGCHSATILTPSPGDAQREEIQRLQSELAKSNARAEELQSKLNERQSKDDPAPMSAEIDAATPRAASVLIDGTSDIDWIGEAGRDGAREAKLHLWVTPRDGRNRFLQVVGSLAVGVACVRPEGEAISIAKESFGPVAVRDAWRGGFMGTHYSFELKFRVPAQCTRGGLTVSIRFDDAQTGRSFDDERRILLPSSESAGAATAATLRTPSAP